MTVLYILGTLLVIAIILALVEKINAFSESRYKYEFFTWGNLFFTTVAYALIIFGKKWYMANYISQSGDPLNGAILVIIGILMVVGLFLYQIYRTGFIFGFVVGLLQIVLYIPASVVSVFAFLIAAAWLSETKPVINLN